MHDSERLVGALVVRDQAHLVRLTIESSMDVVDDYYVIDNESEDDTRDVLYETVADNDLAMTYARRDGYAGKLFLDILNDLDGEGYALRLEGDQVYFPDRLRALRERAAPKTTAAARVAMLRNRFDLMNKEHPVNAPHPTIYYCDGTHEMVDSKLWPRSKYHPRVYPHGGELTDHILGVNCKVMTPAERIKRWHRAAWWRWGSREVDEKFRLDGYDRPYQEHMTLERYVWLLREQGRGSLIEPWGADEAATLDELGRRLIEWDIEHNCVPYTWEYPPRLEQHIDEVGMGGGVVDA